MNEKNRSLWCKLIILFALILRLFEPKIYGVNIDMSLILLMMIVYLRRKNFSLTLLDGIIVGMFSAEIELIGTTTRIVDRAIMQFSYKIIAILILYLLFKIFDKTDIDKIIKNGVILFMTTLLSCTTFLIVFKVIGFHVNIVKLISFAIIPIACVNAATVVVIPKITNFIARKIKGGDENE